MSKKHKIEIGRPTPMSWELTEEQKLNYQTLYVLYLMVEKEIVFPNFMAGNLKFVEEAIELLESKGMIVQEEKIEEGKKILGIKVQRSELKWIYEPTEKAHALVAQYKKRYSEFLALYDVFAHVDPMTGEFALSRIKKLLLEQGREIWDDYLSDPRWVDYRVPVAWYKGIDPREFVFFSFIEEGRFEPSEKDPEHSWARRLFIGDVWNEMYEVLDSAPRWEDQGDDENDPRDIMETIIIEGANVVQDTHKKLKKFIKKQDEIIGFEEEAERVEAHRASDYDEYYEDPVYYHGAYYTPLSDPFFWMTAAIIL